MSLSFFVVGLLPSLPLRVACAAATTSGPPKAAAAALTEPPRLILLLLPLPLLPRAPTGAPGLVLVLPSLGPQGCHGHWCCCCTHKSENSRAAVAVAVAAAPFGAPSAAAATDVAACTGGVPTTLAAATTVIVVATTDRGATAPLAAVLLLVHVLLPLRPLLLLGLSATTDDWAMSPIGAAGCTAGAVAGHGAKAGTACTAAST